MKPFKQLTRRGKVRRFRQVAMNALDHYCLDVCDLRLLGLYTNAVFRVRTTNGSRFALRLCVPGWRTEGDLLAECMWLDALHRDTDIGAPVPVRTREGAYFCAAEAPGAAGNRCMVMSYLPGGLLAKRLTESNLEKMGRLFARLHAHGAAWRPPEGFTQRRMTSVFSRDESVVLFDDAQDDAYTMRTRDLFDRVDRHVNQAFARLYSQTNGVQVIHNDLHHENIKIDRGRLLPFDFEDTLWGYPVQDIAMALQDLMLDVDADTFTSLSAAFRRGYEQLAVWPTADDGLIDTLRAGRMLWVANWIAGHQREHLKGHLDWAAAFYERFLATGMLTKA